MSRYLVFGASGALGAATAKELTSLGHDVIRASRSTNKETDISIDSLDWVQDVRNGGKVDGIVWAQGVNGAGTVLTTSGEELLAAFEANVGFIHKTLNALVDGDALAEKCRGVVISSMWQEHARPNKFAYLVSKAALEGLVKSVAIDLAGIGFSLNAVLPGVIDTPMTRANLTSEQILGVELNSLGGKLALPEHVARTIVWLLSELSEGVTAQFITVDHGWTVNRNV